MTRKQRTDTLAGELDTVAAMNNVPDLPEGVKLSNREEEILWRQMCSARLDEDLTEFHKLLLYKMVKLEVQIRQQQEILDVEGPIVMNHKSTAQVANPRLGAIDMLQRQQMTLIRSMSLANATDARTKNARAANAAAKQKSSAKASTRGSLLAIPGSK